MCHYISYYHGIAGCLRYEVLFLVSYYVGFHVLFQVVQPKLAGEDGQLATVAFALILLAAATIAVGFSSSVIGAVCRVRVPRFRGS